MPFSQSPLNFLYDRTFPGYGNMHTVNVGKMNKVEFANFETSHRANYRVVHSFAGDSYWIIDSGSSENLFSGISSFMQPITTTSGSSSAGTNSSPFATRFPLPLLDRNSEYVCIWMLTYIFK